MGIIQTQVFNPVRLKTVKGMGVSVCPKRTVYPKNQTVLLFSLFTCDSTITI